MKTGTLMAYGIAIFTTGVLGIACLMTENNEQAKPFNQLAPKERQEHSKSEPITNPKDLNILTLDFEDEPCWSLNRNEHFPLGSRYFRRKHYHNTVGTAQAAFHYEYWKCTLVMRWNRASGQGCNQSTANSNMCTSSCNQLSVTAIFKQPGDPYFGEVRRIVNTPEEDEKFFSLCKFGRT